MLPIADVAVVGGSLAGSLAAYHLGRAGHQVLLIDRADEPPEKACGEGLSLIGIRYLRQAGLWRPHLERGARPYFGYRMRFENGRERVIRHFEPIGYTIRRYVIDRAVRAAALDLPAVRPHYANVRAIVHEHGAWAVDTDKGACKARQIIVAAGYAGRRLAGVQRDSTQGAPRRRIGITIRAAGTWRGAEPDCVLIESVGGVQCLITPLVDSYVNVSVLTSEPSEYGLSLSRRDLFAHALQFMARAGFEAAAIEQLHGTVHARTSRPGALIQGLYFAGDSAEIFDPIGGMGMTHALASAALASESIGAALRHPADSHGEWHRYVTRRDRFSVPLRVATFISVEANVETRGTVRAVMDCFPSITCGAIRMMNLCYPIAGGLIGTAASRSNHGIEHSPGTIS